MTYYEELGLDQDATPEEIRDAYRQLVRLLHPDRLQDERQRTVAEIQMRRLNQISETLMNPERRRAYDLSLRDFPLGADMVFVPEPPAPRRRSPASRKPKAPTWGNRIRRQFERRSGLLGLAAGAFLSYLLIPSPEPAPSLAVHSAENAVQASAPAAEKSRPAAPDHGISVLIASLRDRLQRSEAEREEALARLRTMERKFEESTGKPAAAAVPPPATAAPVPPVEMAPSPPAPAAVSPNAPVNKGLSGRWYYVKPPGGEESGDLYPPEYVECVILEEGGGQIRGRYRARYRITDKPISPEVAFQFTGTAHDDSAVLSWAGVGGAVGEVRLRLTNANKMELAWVAHSLGRHQGLGHGSVVLIRRLDP